MDILQANEFNTFLKPERPFLLLSKDKEGHDVVTWHETEDDLMWCVKNNKAVDAYAAIEIGSYRNIKLKMRKRENHKMEINNEFEKIREKILLREPIEYNMVLELLNTIEAYNISTSINHGGFSIKLFSYNLSNEVLDGNNYFIGKYDEIIEGIDHYINGVLYTTKENWAVDAGVIYNLLSMIYSYNKEIGVCNSNRWMKEIFKINNWMSVNSVF